MWKHSVNPFPALLCCALLAAAALGAEPPGDKKPAAPAPAWSEARLAELVQKLADEHFETREAASRELVSVPLGLLPALIAQAGRAEDSEIRTRLMRTARTIFTEQVLIHLAEWRKGRGFLGIQWSLSADPPGVRVVRVIPDTCAERAGLEDGDLILGVGERSFEEGLTNEEAIAIWKEMTPGDTLPLTVRKAGTEERVEIAAQVGEMPEVYRNAGPEADQANGEALWQRYLDGRLKIPEELLSGRPSVPPAPPAAPRSAP